MGYTHYWKVAKYCSQDKFDALVKFVEKGIHILDVLYGIPICGPSGEKDDPVQLSSNVIAFNGLTPYNSGTFLIGLNSGTSNFCDTGRKFYDSLVVATLLQARHLEVITSWSSDGDAPDIVEGSDLRKEILDALVKKPPVFEFNISCTREHLKVIESALSLYSSVLVGQFDEIAKLISYTRDQTVGDNKLLSPDDLTLLVNLLKSLKIRAGLPMYGNLGIESIKVPDLARKAYDIMNTIQATRYQAEVPEYKPFREPSTPKTIDPKFVLPLVRKNEQ